MKIVFWLRLAALAFVPLAYGQPVDYPNRPVKFIVPFSAGAGADIIARCAAKQLQDQLGQPFVVDNRGGANGLIGIAAAKNSPADGYTLLFGSSGTMTINPIFIKDLGYDGVKDFKPVAGITRTHAVWLVSRGSKISSVADLVNVAKANPGKVNVGTYTSSYALLMEWFNRTAGVKLSNVPYKAAGQTQIDLLGGRIDVMIMDISAAAPLLQDGKVRAIATVGSERPDAFKEVPTFAESGYPGYVNYLWNGIYVRADTPTPIVNKLADAMRRVWASSAFAEFSRTSGLEPLALGPDEMSKFHLSDLEKLRSVADVAGIKPE